MSRLLGLGAASAAACALLGGAAALAAAPITVSASPHVVRTGQKVTLRGAGWGVIEYCAPRVVITLRRAVPFSALPIATVGLRTGARNAGTFSTLWTVPRAVHAGLRTIVATQHCHSGKDGSKVTITRTTTVQVK